MNLTNKVVLVTGGAGFIGSHLVERIINDDPKEVVVVDNLYLGNINNITNKNVIIYFDSAASFHTMTKIFNKHHVDVVFNLAVIPLPVSLTDPEFCFNENVRITLTMCELLRKNLYNKLVHFSSSEVYGTAKFVPMNETHPLDGITPYAASKAACDQLVLSYYRTFGLDISIVRPFNTYGPRQNSLSYAGVIPLTLKRIKNKELLVIEGTGRQTRDFTYVTDIANGAIKVYEQSRGVAINIASGKETTIESIIKILNTENLPVIYKQERAGDVTRHKADINLAKVLNYQPIVSLEEGLNLTREWYLKETK